MSRKLGKAKATAKPPAADVPVKVEMQAKVKSEVDVPRAATKVNKVKSVAKSESTTNVDKVKDEIDIEALVAAASSQFIALCEQEDTTSSVDIFETVRDTQTISTKRALGLDETDANLDVAGVSLSTHSNTNDGKRPTSVFITAKAVRSTLYDREKDLEQKALAVSQSSGDLPTPFQQKEQKTDTAGKAWFDLPAQKITPELKMDLALMSMKNMLDKSHYYHVEKGDAIPKYFHVGYEAGSAADMWSGFGSGPKKTLSFAESLLRDSEVKQDVRKRLQNLASRQSARKRVKPTYIR